jgi:hypothetical protein
MKRLITVIGILLTLLAGPSWAVEPINLALAPAILGGAGAGVAAATSFCQDSTHLGDSTEVIFCESFDNTSAHYCVGSSGDNNCFYTYADVEGVPGTIDWTTTTGKLEGTYSFSSSSSALWYTPNPTFAAQSEVWLTWKVTLSETGSPSSLYNPRFLVGNATQAYIRMVWDGDMHRWGVSCGDKDANDCSGGDATVHEGTYYIKLHYKAGTGNAEIHSYYSTAAAPSTWITGGSRTIATGAAVTQVAVGGFVNAATTIIDCIQVRASDISDPSCGP